jgi:Pyridoxamine 5'-phosphate oxidase
MSHSVRHLTHRECVARLRGELVGRVSVSVRALPAIALVEYHVDAHSLLFSAGLDEPVGAWCDGAVVAFEVDGRSEWKDTLWSVSVVGIPSLVAGDDVRSVLRLDLAEATGLERTDATTAAGSESESTRSASITVLPASSSHPSGDPDGPRSAEGQTAQGSQNTSRYAPIRPRPSPAREDLRSVVPDSAYDVNDLHHAPK